MILTKNEADAKKAKKELADGESFAEVAKKYSIDPASKTQGGKLPGFVEGQQDPALSKAVFSASTGKVYGPIKTGLGYYLFEVTKINNAKTAKLDAEAKAQARALLESQDQQVLYNKYLTKFQKKWKAVTVCAKGYIIQLCRNAPKQPTNPSGIPTMPGGSPVPGIPPTGQPNIPTPSQ